MSASLDTPTMMTRLNSWKKDGTTLACKIVWATPDIDQRIVYMARVSNPNALPDDPGERLIGYLIRNRHWSPFEMASICMEVQTTRDIARQILRHRSFHFQEFSQRYAEAPPEPIVSEARLQDPRNRQSSTDTDDPDLQEWWLHAQEHTWDEARARYKGALERGIAKEVARKLLPEGLTETKMYMSGTVRDWYHYFGVRLADGTQKEHRDVAFEMLKMCRQVSPLIFNHYGR